jgi:hypothetical protein
VVDLHALIYWFSRGCLLFPLVPHIVRLVGHQGKGMDVTRQEKRGVPVREAHKQLSVQGNRTGGSCRQCRARRLLYCARKGREAKEWTSVPSMTEPAGRRTQQPPKGARPAKSGRSPKLIVARLANRIKQKNNPLILVFGGKDLVENRIHSDRNAAPALGAAQDRLFRKEGLFEQLVAAGAHSDPVAVGRDDESHLPGRRYRPLLPVEVRLQGKVPYSGF